MPKSTLTMPHKFIEFFKRSFVEEKVHSFARGELAGLVFALTALRAAAGFRLGVQALQMFEFVFVRHLFESVIKDVTAPRNRD